MTVKLQAGQLSGRSAGSGEAVCKTVGLASIHRIVVSDLFWPGPVRICS
jgi:hypothetical protein